MPTELNRINEQKKRDFGISNMLIAFIVIVLLVALIGLAGFVFFRPKAAPIVGQVEVDEVRISGKVPGRIELYLVEEGQMVYTGDTLVRIYSPEVLAKQEQALAAEQAAKAQELKAQHGARVEEKQGAYELWQKARAGLDIATRSFARVENLYKQGVLPAQKHDEAKANLEAMQASERAAKSQYDMAINGARSEDKMAARAMVARAGGARQEVDAYISEGVLLSPIDGCVSDIFPRRGELVGAGAPIMNIQDPSRKRVIFAIREDKLAGTKVGTSLKAFVPALGDKKLMLRVTKLKDLGSFSTWKATKPTEDIDLHTFEVTAVPEGNVEDLLPGMSVVLGDKVH